MCEEAIVPAPKAPALQLLDEQARELTALVRA
jgi:hypothetical protein